MSCLQTKSDSCSGTSTNHAFNFVRTFCSRQRFIQSCNNNGNCVITDQLVVPDDPAEPVRFHTSFRGFVQRFQEQPGFRPQSDRSGRPPGRPVIVIEFQCGRTYSQQSRQHGIFFGAQLGDRPVMDVELATDFEKTLA